MTKEEADLIITEQNKSTEEILKAVAKVKSDYHELCKLKDMRIAELEAHIEKMQEKLKADLIARLKEQMQYSTSPSCTKGMELFIKSIEKWEIKEK